MKRTIALAALALASLASADVYFGGEQYDKAYVGGQEFTGVEVAGEAYAGASGSSYTFMMTLDRTFSGHTPAAGPNVGSQPRFTHDGTEWRVWQVIPFLGPGIGTVGDLRLQADKVGQAATTLALADMPDRVRVAHSSWTGSPWTFERPASGISTPGNNRRAVDYDPVGRTPTGTPAQSGISTNTLPGEGQTFSVTIFFDD